MTGSAVNWGSTGDLTFDLGHTWQLDLSGAFAQELDHRNQDHAVDTAFLDEALGNTPDNPLTKFSTAKDGFFNPFGAGRDNSAAVMGFIDSGFVHSWTPPQVPGLSFSATWFDTHFTNQIGTPVDDDIFNVLGNQSRLLGRSSCLDVARIRHLADPPQHRCPARLQTYCWQPCKMLILMRNGFVSSLSVCERARRPSQGSSRR